MAMKRYYEGGNGASLPPLFLSSTKQWGLLLIIATVFYIINLHPD